MHGFLRLQEKTGGNEGREGRAGAQPRADGITSPSLPRLVDRERTPELDRAQASRRPSRPRWRPRAPVRASLDAETAEPVAERAQSLGPHFPAVLASWAFPGDRGGRPAPRPRRASPRACARLKAARLPPVRVGGRHPLGPATGRKGKAADEPEHYEVTTCSGRWERGIAPRQPGRVRLAAGRGRSPRCSSSSPARTGRSASSTTSWAWFRRPPRPAPADDAGELRPLSAPAGLPANLP